MSSSATSKQLAASAPGGGPLPQPPFATAPPPPYAAACVPSPVQQHPVAHGFVLTPAGNALRLAEAGGPPPQYYVSHAVPTGGLARFRTLHPFQKGALIFTAAWALLIFIGAAVAIYFAVRSSAKFQEEFEKKHFFTFKS